MRIVMNHSAKDCLAIACIFSCIEDVLMPELVKVISAI
jgi:hypothetical protein